MGVFLAALRFQLWTARRSPDQMLVLVITPLFTAMFVSITQHAGRDDLLGHAVLAPVLMGLWQTALALGGGLIDDDREQGTLEALVATPASLAVVVAGRVAALTVLGLATFVEALAVAWLVFGETVAVPHPGVLAAGLLASALAMAGTATLMAAAFVLSRSALQYQNALSYPFYVLGGVLVPVALLPGWARPFSAVVFLSWSADLLRDALSPAPVAGVGWRLAVICALGAAGLAGGRLALRAVLDRVRTTGTIGYV